MVSMSASRASTSRRRGNDEQIAAVRKGLEVILFGALGLVINAIVLWNTRYKWMQS